MAKRVLITGATNGIGKATARALLKKGFEVVMLVRNEDKAKSVKHELQKISNAIDYRLVDLADLSSIKNLSQELIKEQGRIDVLINNAGGIFQQREESEQGVEMHFALNHLGHFFLVKELLPLLKQSKTRIINVSSEAHRAAQLDLNDFQSKKKYQSMVIYGNAKLCNILFSKSLVDKFGSDGIESYSLHPGVVKTGFAMNSKGIWKFVFKLIRPLLSTPEQGAETSVFLASQPEIISENGSYFKQKKRSIPSRAARDPQLREDLWKLSEKIIKKKGF